jgi:hypothetical protein
MYSAPVNSVLGEDGLRLDSRPDTQSRDQDLRESTTPALLERRWVYELGYAVLLAGAVTLVLSPVLRRSGWLLDQGTTGPLLLVQMYAAHIRHLDLLPVWSSSDGVGMGSPILLYYHHAFFYLAGTISLLGLGLKASVVTTIAIFLVIGAYGMRRVLTLVTTSRLLCVVGSLGFLFTNYVFTDWFVPRGDPAEFSALMIVPWLLYWCLALVKFQRFSYLIVPIMVLLLNAHSAIALTSLFLLAIAFAVFIASAGRSGLRAVAGRLVLSVVGTTILLAPLLLAELRFGHIYDPQTKGIAGGYNASQQFLTIGRYLYDGHHQWFAQNQTPPWFNFVQIDFAIWIPIAGAVAFVVVRWTMRGAGRVPSASRRARSDSAVLVFLIASFACYLFLQLRISSFVYRILTPLQFINFPWRMLAYITPLGVVLVVIVADKAMPRIRPRSVRYALVAIWFASLVVLSPIPTSEGAGITATRLSSIALFMAPKSIDYQTFQGFFTTSGFPPGPLYDIFLPKVLTPDGHEVGPNSIIPLYQRLHQHQSGAQSLTRTACTVVAPSHAAFETLSLTFTVRCKGHTRLALPISYNAYSTVLVQSAGGRMRQIPYFHDATDPRIIIRVPGANTETVVVHLPTLWGSLF